MRQAVLILFTICLAAWGNAFGKPPLSPASKRVQAAYLAWKKHPTSTAQQQRLLAAFPQTKAGFTAVFDPRDFGQLYGTSWGYIYALQKIGAAYPGPTLRYCLTIAKAHPIATDAGGALQDVTVKLALAHPKVFASEAAKLPGKERRELLHFLADVEAIEDYAEYGSLIQTMAKNGFPGYASELRQAKQWRLRQPMH